MAPTENNPGTALLAKIAHIRTLLTHFTTTLTTPPPPKEAALPSRTSPNPLHVLRDAASLLKAQTTKLGLLIINDPFTPSAVQKVLAACEGECLPAIMGAVELCHPKLWGRIMLKEVRLRAVAVVSGFGEILADIERKVNGDQLTTTTSKKAKDSTLASTGQVWAACDGLTELEKMGVVTLVVQKVEGFRSVLKDALEELKEWGEDEEDQDEGFMGSDKENDDRDSIEDMFSAANKLPAHRADLRELLEESQKRLKLVDMLYQAVVKRRLKPFPFKAPPLENTETEEATEARLHKLDTLVELLDSIPGSVDDLANAFYELDASGVNSLLDKICNDAKNAALLVKKSWVDRDDEFTVWATKWEDAITKKTSSRDSGTK